jgi:hypothetical protein
MKNNVSVTARACVAIAASIFAFSWASASTPDSAGASKLAADFQAIADSDLLVLGPVDLVEPSKARVQILGQWIPLSQKQINQGLEGLVGHVLAVYGSVTADGSLEVVTVREQDSTDYVPGATHLYLKGSVSALDSLHGTARIGALSVNYSNALHSLVAEDLSVGAIVSFSGLQFVGSNALYADNGLVHNTNVAQTLGQTSSGITSLGQTGSGIKSLGQTGSGITSLGQTGSGIKSLGQTGSGITSLGQTGSGIKSLGQTGSGITSLGQTGSGIKSLGQTGSGITSLGQTGSGIKSLGQTGSGITSLGQTGSGIKSLGQTGSGITSLGQTGSGIKSLGQTGSGITSLGQTGSGIKSLGQTGSGIKSLGQTGSGL